jgi:predicted site-specific integrase-resolvase
MVSGIDSRCVALYVRVSGSTGQETSLFAQERELRAALSASVEVTVFTDRESGLNEHRRGLTRLRRDVAKGVFAEVWVTHEDRLTRFGVDFLRAEFAAHGVELRVLHEREDASPEQELLDDFMSLLASFSGRVYGQRSAAARCRLVEAANAGKASGK